MRLSQWERGTPRRAQPREVVVGPEVEYQVEEQVAEDQVAEDHEQVDQQVEQQVDEQVDQQDPPVAHHPPYSRSHRSRPALRPAPQLLNPPRRQRPGARRARSGCRNSIPKG